MIENYSREIKLDKPDLKKYRLAGFGFLVLNILYIIVAWWKLPPIDLAMSKIVYVSFFVFIAIVLIVTPFILNGGKTLVKVLAFHVWRKSGIFNIYFDRWRCLPCSSLFVALCDANVLFIRKSGLGLVVVIKLIDFVLTCSKLKRTFYDR